MPTIKEQEAVLRARYGATTWRTVKPVRCRTCKRWTLRGLDYDLCAFTATVDPEPLSLQGEALARILGLDTYTLRRCGAGTSVTRRNRFDIQGKPAGGGKYDIVAAHSCSAPAFPAIPSTITDPTEAAIDDGPCPY